MDNIELRLRNMAEKWHTVNREVSDLCRDAAEEIRVMKLKGTYADDLIHDYKRGTGWGIGSDE